jgi:hypothetical protein
MKHTQQPPISAKLQQLTAGGGYFQSWANTSVWFPILRLLNCLHWHCAVHIDRKIYFSPTFILIKTKQSLKGEIFKDIVEKINLIVTNLQMSLWRNHKQIMLSLYDYQKRLKLVWTEQISISSSFHYIILLHSLLPFCFL